jgi:hypothetical protein
MHTIRIPLQENNLAEVLAGIAILGILEIHGPNANCCSWHHGILIIEAALSEPELLQKVHDFLIEMQWVQSLGDVHQGVFKSGNLIGVSPFMDCANHGTPSIFKNFSGQVTCSKIAEDQHQAIIGIRSDSFSDWLAVTVTEVSSWGLDWRTNAHSLDIGFSPNDDNTSKFNPIFPAVEVLATAALAFFLAPSCLLKHEESLTYFLWRDSIPSSLTAQALIGNVNGLQGKSYEVARRPKSYGKGASYKYFPAAIIKK